MERIQKLFPRYEPQGKELIYKAFCIAEEALKEQKRSNGAPFIEHPLAVARIACDEIGLSAECIAAVFLHEATRFFPDTDIATGGFGKDVYTIVDGLNKISTIKPKDTKLEAENYKKLIVSYSRDPRVTILKIADRLAPATRALYDAVRAIVPTFVVDTPKYKEIAAVIEFLKK